MRPSANSGPWVFLVVITGLALTCVSGQLLEPVPSVLSPFGPSEPLLRMAAMLNGNFSTEDQPGDHVYALVSIPVRMNPLTPDPSFFFEHTIDNTVVRRHITVLQETDYGGIKFKLYNFTAQLPDSPLTRPEILSLQNIALNFLEHHGDECDGTFYPIPCGMFFSSFPECDAVTFEMGVTFPFLLDCNGLNIQGHRGVPGGRPAPYLFKVKERYPVLFHSYSVSQGYYYDVCPGDN